MHPERADAAACAQPRAAGVRIAAASQPATRLRRRCRRPMAVGDVRRYGRACRRQPACRAMTEPDGPRARRARPGCATRPTPGPGSPGAGRARLHLPRRRTATPIRDRAILAADPRPGHPAGLDRRLDLPDPNGHLQATGRDARGRKQYRYHARWRDRARRRQVRAAARLRARPCRGSAGAATRTWRDAGPAPREGPGGGRPAARADAHPRRQRRVRAAQPLVRADDAARAATPRVDGTAVRFRFRGKCGQPARGRPARSPAGHASIRRCQELPGQELFQYVDDDGEPRDIASDDVNDYLREISGDDFTAKDFRTWAGTVLAYRALRALSAGRPTTGARRNVVEAIRDTADSSATRRPSPGELRPPGRPGRLPGRLVRGALSRRPRTRPSRPRCRSAEERQVVALLRKRIANDRNGRERGSRSRKRKPAPAR